MSAVDRVQPDKERSIARHRSIAWLVMLISFALFCLMLFGLFQLGNLIYNSSTTNLTATVVRNTGSNMTIKRVVSANSEAPAPNAQGEVRAELNEGDVVQTGADTQATINFPDGSVVHIFPSSRVTINQIKANRFTKENVSIVLSDEPYTVASTAQSSFIIATLVASPTNGYRSSDMTIIACIKQDKPCDGRIASIVPQPNSRVRVSVGSDHNSPAGGYYGRAAVLQGTVTMLNLQADDATSEQLALYQMGTVGWGGKGNPAVAESWDELLADGNFSREGVGAVAQDNDFWGPPQPNQGSDGGTLNAQVSITDTLVYTQQVHAANFYRGSGLPNYSGPLTDYASISIGQQLDLDLAPYIPGGTVRLAADIKIVNQSVPGGGGNYVEYPIIFKLLYENSDNAGEPSWEYGYYAVPDPNTPPVPAERGQQIAAGKWVHVEVPNLLAIEQLRGMRRIVRLYVYAAGHEFDAMVTHISLSAR